MTGKIIKGIAGFYYVHGSDQVIYECRAKGILRNQKQKPLVGDDVEITVLKSDPPTGNLERILPRKSVLIRPAVANIDQALVVFALVDPIPNFNLLDRLLVLMERNRIPATLAFNKTDLAGGEAREQCRSVYEPAGYRVMFVSVRERTGLEDMGAYLEGKTTALAGPSGAGKSSLTNLLMPEANMETGDLSEKIRRGKHTTRHSELFCLGRDTYLMDTPGFSSVSVEEQEPEECKQYFPEFAAYEGRCRFPGCVHVGEKECGVKAAVGAGAISQSRYEHYRLFYQESKSKRRY